MYSDNDLSLEKTLNMYNVVIVIKPVFNKNHNHYCYEAFQINVHIDKIKMLYYSSTEVSEGIVVNQKSASKECIINH